MLWHIARLAHHIKSKTDSGIKTMIWHDMIVNMSPTDITKIKNMTSLVEPVIWMYAENLDMFLQPYIWQSLKVRARLSNNRSSNICRSLTMCGARLRTKVPMAQCVIIPMCSITFAIITRGCDK